MSVHKSPRALMLLAIAAASLFLDACANSNYQSSSISVASPPTPTDRAPSAEALVSPTPTPDPLHPPISIDELGAESSRSTVNPAAAAAATPMATGPTAAGSKVTSRASAPEIAVVPTLVPSPTAELPEPTVQPVVTFQNYVVRRGDSLTYIANQTGVSAASIMQLNGIRNPNWLYVGQVLRIKMVVQAGRGPGDKLIPDSEAVYSPAYKYFDVDAFAKKYNGYLVRYRENVEGMSLTGPQIIQLISERFSIGPRVLLTLLEMQGGWVTGNPATMTQLYYPMGYGSPTWSGLYRQVWYAADKLNEGYYGLVYKTLDNMALNDGTRIAFSSRINPGTAAIQNYFAQISAYNNWQKLIGPSGFSAAYRQLFGDPFAYAIEPLVPENLVQPNLHLPWEEGHTWWFTGGPHGGWADGSAWAAVDFAPSQGSGSCRPSKEWATAAAPGAIVQAENGRVMENLDGSNFQGEGWTLMYMHMASAGRVQAGDQVKVGDHIGHPSCEGGVSTADHLHFARLYNGQWLAAADRQRPLTLSGWKLQGGGSEYDGSMTRGSDYLEAYNGHSVMLNAIVSDDGPVPNTAGDDSSGQGGSGGVTNSPATGVTGNPAGANGDLAASETQAASNPAANDSSAAQKGGGSQARTPTRQLAR